MTKKTGQRFLGNSLARTASNVRSAGVQRGRATCRRNTSNCWRSTAISASFASGAGPRPTTPRSHRRITNAAAGKLIALGNGRFRVYDPNWDNGEILIQQDGQILPQHGLDTTRGQVALYSCVPAWHELGTIVPGGTGDVDAVLKLGGIDFDLLPRPVEYRNSLDGPSLVLPEHFVTVRDDTDAGLGVVGSKYEVLQNRDAFGFLQDLVDRYDVVWECHARSSRPRTGTHIDLATRQG